MPLDLEHDRRIIMTLDAGGNTLKFSAIRGLELLFEPRALPTHVDDLERCLADIRRGFHEVGRLLPEPAVAISFAFPGPADYPKGIIGDLPNLPAFRGGVALGPMLEDEFGLPVFINNDGDLFVYGEAIAGFLPYVNGLLEEAGSERRYRNLFGVTLGTGFGGGIVRNGELFVGDNAIGGEAWLLRNRLDARFNADEGASIRAVRRAYAELTGIPATDAPEPKRIFEIGMGRAQGNGDAAREAFRRMAVVAGDAIAQALTLIDGLAVIGGGMANAHPLFRDALLRAVNDVYARDGEPLKRLIARAYDFEDPAQRDAFLRGSTRTITVPGSGRHLSYDPEPRTAIGLSRLGTSRAVAIGAAAFALRKLDTA